jgi:hypothetical protein
MPIVAASRMARSLAQVSSLYHKAVKDMYHFGLTSLEDRNAVLTYLIIITYLAEWWLRKDFIFVRDVRNTFM